MAAITSGSETASAREIAQLKDEIKRLHQLVGRQAADLALYKEAMEVMREKNGLRANPSAARLSQASSLPAFWFDALLFDQAFQPNQGLNQRTILSQGSRIRNQRLHADRASQKCMEIFPTFGYKRLTACVNRRLSEQSKPHVNRKRVDRLLRSENLLFHKVEAHLPDASRDHDGRVAVGASNKR